MKIALLGGSNCIIHNGIIAHGLKNIMPNSKLDSKNEESRTFQNIDSKNTQNNIERNKQESTNKQAHSPLHSQFLQNTESKSHIEITNNEVHNFSLGNSSSLQNLYEAFRQDVCDYDLIVTESALNDTGWVSFTRGVDKDFCLNAIYLLYHFLFRISHEGRAKKVVILFCPFGDGKTYNYGRKNLWREEIFTAHKMCAKKFGFNVINAYQYYEKHNLFCAFNTDKVHEPGFILEALGQLIARNYHSFFFPKKLDEVQNVIENDYKVIYANEMALEKAKSGTLGWDAGFRAQDKEQNKENKNENLKITKNILIENATPVANIGGGGGQCLALTPLIIMNLKLKHEKILKISNTPRIKIQAKIA